MDASTHHWPSWVNAPDPHRVSDVALERGVRERAVTDAAEVHRPVLHRRQAAGAKRNEERCPGSQPPLFAAPLGWETKVERLFYWTNDQSQLGWPCG